MIEIASMPSPLGFRDRINDTLETLLPAVSGQPWAFLDWPWHSNVGDSAIWLGALTALERRFGCPPAYLSRSSEFPTALDVAMPEGTVFLHGGGNFGDLWGGVHTNRIAILKAFKHRPIIQLPQSIYFVSPDCLEETKRAIGDHPNFTLMVRDRASFAFATTQFQCPILLCPDLAYGLGKLEPLRQPNVDVFSLLRSDIERRQGNPGYQLLVSLGPCSDWTRRETPALHHALDALYPDVLYRYFDLTGLRLRAYRRYSQKELLRGTRMLAQGRLVITDRLHGHILCHMMGIPHIVLDNNYGKIFGFIESWPIDNSTFLASSLRDIEAILASRKQ